ncbi:hypothetical protein DV702_14610 [Sporosarcina sp. PTS2304]|uniref:hypothetical protein n=1 Tax=Sporosarcina sp. PTS2304 TaxID=2283194 RepID=UPI000E0D2D1A|nr:hypothetical protein [Sporosarcina sp. PTS2304]AXI00829.1 hypothetical protein DV702_14610 [Sporosarcina sp. PTS2304]
MLTEFPIVHTNIWDAVWGVPVVLVIVLLAKWLLNVPLTWLSTVATASGLFLSIFVSHPGNLSAGIFMGFFYSGAAMGIIFSTKQSLRAYRNS